MGVPTLTWVPSHKTEEVARARGFLYENWFGNGKADKAAKDRALLREPPLALMEKHRRRQLILSRCLSVIAHVQEAVLIRDHAPGVHLAKAKKLPPVEAPSEPVLRRGRREFVVPEVCPAGVHEVGWPCFVQNKGQVEKFSDANHVNFSWPLICKNCRKRATWTHQWSGFTRTVCPSTGDPLTM